MLEIYEYFLFSFNRQTGVLINMNYEHLGLTPSKCRIGDTRPPPDYVYHSSSHCQIGGGIAPAEAFNFECSVAWQSALEW